MDLNKLKKFLVKWRLDYIFLGLIMTAHYTRIQWNDYIGDPDGFFHAKIASLLMQGQLLKSLPWMQYSTLRDHFTDQHFIYHLLQAPLTLINNDPLLGVKISAVIFAVALVLVFYWFLKKLHLSWPWLFSLLFVTLSSLNFRLSLIKITALSLIMVWLIIYALFKKKYRTLAVLGFSYVWLYGGWPLSILLFFIFYLTDKIYAFIHHQKIKLFHNKIVILLNHPKENFDLKKLGAYLGLGLLAGIIINPYFPYSLWFYLQLMNISVFNTGQDFPVGGEWYGTDFASIVSSSPHFFILAVIIFILLFFNIKKASRLTWFSFILTFVFLLLTVKSKRYVEYYAPFLLFFVASGVTDVIKVISWSKISKFWEDLGRWLRLFLMINAFILCVVIMPKIYQHIFDINIPENPRLRYQAPAQWLEKNTPAGSIVFHTDWDEWPMLFYFNDHNRYLIGLDFTLMYRYDAALQQKYLNIAKGKVNTRLAQEIKENFKAEYIFAEKADHEDFIRNLDQDPNLPLLYQDQYFKIYKIDL